MTRLNIHSTLIILISLLLASCGGGNSNSGGGQDDDISEMDMVEEVEFMRIVALGDSIGTGFGLATPWPTRLANLIGQEIENASADDELTPFGVSIIQQLIDENNPSHIFILLGTNDALRGGIGTAISNLQTMVNIAQNNGVIAIVGTLPPLTRPDTDDQRAAEISQGIQNLSGARIANVRAALGSGSDTIADGIHPNDQGQQLIAEAFAAQF